MKLLIMLLIISLSSCTMYSVKKQMPDGSVTTVEIKSTRDLEQPEVGYTRTGKDATFSFSAASVDNNTEAMLGLFQGMMGMMMEMMQNMMAAQMLPTPEQ